MEGRIDRVEAASDKLFELGECLAVKIFALHALKQLMRQSSHFIR